MRYIRGIIYVFSLDLGLLIFLLTYHHGGIGNAEVTQAFGILATLYLYLALLPSPLYQAFPHLPGLRPAQRAKKALGISSFFFACIHSWDGFFTAFGGFAMLPYWGMSEIWSLEFGLAALIILAALTITSIKRIKRAMGPSWKPLHRFVYLAGILTYIHIVTITIHSLHTYVWLAVAYLPTIFLLGLQTLRFDRWIARQHPELKGRVMITAFPALSIVVLWSFFFISHHRH